jgi:hypothetical protein
MPNTNPDGTPATHTMQPYYFPTVSASDGGKLQGLFDYRPRNTEEALVAAYSVDGGRNWIYQSEALDFNFRPVSIATTPDPVNGTDDGQGHAFAMRVGGTSFLYTLDRQGGSGDLDTDEIDHDGLLVHRLQTGAEGEDVTDPLRGLLAVETPPFNKERGGVETTGLDHPDGIIGVIPGTNQILYVSVTDGGNPSSICGGKAVHVHLADINDGINFTTHAGEVTGLSTWNTTDPAQTCGVTSRGTIVRADDGRLGLFFSGGINADGDADSFHYIGYAESTDGGKSWTVINGLDHDKPLADRTGHDNPILECAPAPAGCNQTPGGTGPVPWLSGRVYDPQVIVNGGTATMVFAAYATGKPKNDLDDYRTIGVVTLHQSDEAP